MPVKSEGLFHPRDFVKKLKEFLKKRINVEFECGNCCKRVTGGTLVEVGSDFIRLEGDINIIIFIPGLTKPIIKKARIIVIPIIRICDIERPW